MVFAFSHSFLATRKSHPLLGCLQAPAPATLMHKHPQKLRKNKSPAVGKILAGEFVQSWHLIEHSRELGGGGVVCTVRVVLLGTTRAVPSGGLVSVRLLTPEVADIFPIPLPHVCV